MKCRGLHCDGCGGGGGGGLAVLVLLGALVMAGIAQQIVSAAMALIEVALITAGSLLGLAAIGGIAYMALRAHNGQARNRQAMVLHAPARQAITGPLRGAIEPPRAGLNIRQQLADPGRGDTEVTDREPNRRTRDT